MDRLAEAHREVIEALESGQRVLTSVAGSRVVGKYRPVPDCVRPLADAVADPARFWGLAASGALGGSAVIGQNGAADLTAAAIRAAAGKLKAGDFGPIREALMGQGAWLGATAVRLMALTAEVEPGPKAAEQRAELVRLALRASDQAAKVLASAAALNAIGDGQAVTVG